MGALRYNLITIAYRGTQQIKKLLVVDFQERDADAKLRLSGLKQLKQLVMSEREGEGGGGELEE